MSFNSVNEAFEAIAAKTSDLLWLTSNYNRSTGKLELIETGSTDIYDFTSKLEDNKVIFGVYKVYGVDEHESVTSKRDKLICFIWVGENVPPLQRNAVLASKPLRDEVFRGCHLTIQTSDKKGLDINEITRQLLASGGAHTPTSYLFGNVEYVVKTKEIVTRN